MQAEECLCDGLQGFLVLRTSNLELHMVLDFALRAPKQRKAMGEKTPACVYIPTTELG